MKTTKPTPRIEPVLIVLLAAVGLGVFALFQAPQFFGEAPPSSPEYAANRERIEQMTQSQRDRVKHRFKKFQEMSASRRNELRNLHADLQTAPDAKELKQALERYNTWLTSLSVGERDDLRRKLSKAKTPREQRQIVLEKKREVDVERLLQSAHRFDREEYKRTRDPARKEEILARIRETYAYGRQRRRSPTLKPEELDAVVNVIAGLLKPTPKQTAEWQKLEPQQRRLQIMIAALQEHTRRSIVRRMVNAAVSVLVPVLNEQFPRRRRPEPGLLSDAGLRQPIQKGIADPELRERLLKEPAFPPRFPFSRFPRYRILSLISSTFFAERRQESANVTDDQLGRFFENLTEQKMEELTQQGPEQMKTLKRWYLFFGGKTGKDYRTFVTQYYSFIRSRPFGGFQRGGPRGNKSGRRGRGRGRSGQRSGNSRP